MSIFTMTQRPRGRPAMSTHLPTRWVGTSCLVPGDINPERSKVGVCLRMNSATSSSSPCEACRCRHNLTQHRRVLFLLLRQGCHPRRRPCRAAPTLSGLKPSQLVRSGGKALADKDIQLSILQDRSSGHSVWDTLTPEQKKAHTQRIQDDFARLRVPPQYDKPELISAQDDGFMAGVQTG